MGVSWSVTLVSKDSEETLVPVDVLCSASAVWRERLQLAGSLSPMPRAKENCTGEEINAFVCVLFALSQDTERSPKKIPIATLAKALPLVHKYDCKGAKQMLDDLDEYHVPDHGVKLFPDVIYNHLGQLSRSKGCAYVTEPWLTQHCLDYLVLKQELWGEQNIFPESVKKLFAVLLTRQQIFDRAYLEPHGHGNNLRIPAESVFVAVERQPIALIEILDNTASQADKGDVTIGSPLVMQGWRLSASTFAALMPYMTVNF